MAKQAERAKVRSFSILPFHSRLALPLRSTDASSLLPFLLSQNVAPATTSEEILKRRDDVVYHCSGILNKPKPRVAVPPKTDAPPPPAKEEELAVEDEGAAVVEEMDADELD